jgi:hypothetical protein
MNRIVCALLQHRWRLTAPGRAAGGTPRVKTAYGATVISPVAPSKLTL